MSEHDNPSIHSEITTETDDAVAEFVAEPEAQPIEDTTIYFDQEESISDETEQGYLFDDESQREEIENEEDLEANEEVEESKGEEEVAEILPQEDATSLVEDIIHDLLIDAIKEKEKPPEQLSTAFTENDHLLAFIQDILDALGDDLEKGDREYDSHKEAYFWMTFFFLHFCGYKIFLQNIAHQEDIEHVANIVVDIVDYVVDHADYLRNNSDIPEHVAKNVMWQILNSRTMRRRYDNKSIAQCQAGDILEEIVSKVVTKERAVPSFSIPTLVSTESEEVELKEPIECREFGGIFNIAEHFVSSILRRSIVTAAAHDREKSSEVDISTYVSTKPLRKLPMFPAIKDFTVKIGKATIISIIDAWQKYYWCENWLFSVKFIMGHSDPCSDFYTYKAKFGLHTPMYPIPQATCTVLFKIEVSRVKPELCPVNITFKVEASGLVQTVDEYEFHETWLLNVINAKLRLFSKLQF